MKFLNRLVFQTITLSTTLLATHSFATQLFEFTINNPPGNPGGGDITSIHTTYHPSDETFTWHSTSTQTNSQFTDSFWLVISPGPNPKSMVDEYALMIGDLTTGTLTNYIYNGENSNNSWQDPNRFISSSGPGFINVSDMGNERTYEFTLDASFINSFLNTPDWVGVEFGEMIGVWYHPAIGSTITYNNDGTINSYSMEGSGWYDTEDNNTILIYSPGAIPLFSLSLCMIPLLTRKRSD